MRRTTRLGGSSAPTLRSSEDVIRSRRTGTRTPIRRSLLLAAIAAHTLAFGPAWAGDDWRAMKGNITDACAQNPYGPACLGNIDAYRNARGARDNPRYDYDCRRYPGPWGWNGCWRPCEPYGCDDGWSEDWRR
jgi:hypothetical protein